MTGCFQGIWAGGGPTNLCSAAEKKSFWDGANQSVYEARVANGRARTITPLESRLLLEEEEWTDRFLKKSGLRCLLLFVLFENSASL